MFDLRCDHRASDHFRCLNNLPFKGCWIDKTQNAQRLFAQCGFPLSRDHQQGSGRDVGHRLREHRNCNNGSDTSISCGLSHYDVSCHRVSKQGDPSINIIQAEGKIDHFGRLVHQKLRGASARFQITRHRVRISAVPKEVKADRNVACLRKR